MEHSLAIQLSVPATSENPVSQLRMEYQACQDLLQAQPEWIQRILTEQAARLTEAIGQGSSQVHYHLPESVVLRNQGQELVAMPVPSKIRNQAVKSIFGHLIHFNLLAGVNKNLARLERSTNQGTSASAILLRHALVMNMVHGYLPPGWNVLYRTDEGDEIPCQPISSTDQDGDSQIEPGNGFFLPQWVAFDDKGNLLASDTKEAYAKFDLMKRYLNILDAAVDLAPYMVVDGEYQDKHYGILGQLVNQGRALARYEVGQICEKIRQRATSHDLDRGFSLSLPYFNDQTLALELYNFEVVPPGRVMFLPTFMVLAVRAQGAKVIGETRFNRMTRLNLVKELYTLERTFLE